MYIVAIYQSIQQTVVSPENLENFSLSFVQFKKNRLEQTAFKNSSNLLPKILLIPTFRSEQVEPRLSYLLINRHPFLRLFPEEEKYRKQ